MAKIHIPCLVEKSRRDGASFYWQPSATLARAGWQSQPLGKDRAQAYDQAGTINAKVAAWKAGGKPPEGVAIKPGQGTFAELASLYRAKVLAGTKPNGTPLLAAKTRENYATSLVRLEAWAGDRPLAWITRARVWDLRDESLKAIGHAPAFVLLKLLRQVLAFAVKRDMLDKNPAADFDLAPPPPRRHVWSADDEAAFIASAYELGLPSMALAIELALYTAQRSGDLIRFTEAQWQELTLEHEDPRLRKLFAGDDGRVFGWVFAQRKTTDEYESTDMELPIEPKLRPRIEAALRANRARDRAASPPRLISHVLIDDRTGKPWNEREFGRAWTEVLEHAAARCDRPRMLELVWHDLRRTRVVRLRRRRMPKEMIATITGHSLRAIEAMLKVYGPVDPTMTAAALASTLEEAA